MGPRYVHLPVTPDTRSRAGAARWSTLLEQHDVDLIVLARYMQILSTDVRAPLPEPDHQHPPLVPARVPRRAAVPPGARPGRQDHRRHRALRDRGARRGSDHRTGRDARLAPGLGRRPGAQGPGPRTHGPGARGPGPPGAPGPDLRTADRRLRVERAQRVGEAPATEERFAAIVAEGPAPPGAALRSGGRDDHPSRHLLSWKTARLSWKTARPSSASWYPPGRPANRREGVQKKAGINRTAGGRTNRSGRRLERYNTGNPRNVPSRTLTGGEQQRPGGP